MPEPELTPNAVLVRRALIVTAIALAALLVLALLSARFGREFVLAIDAANTAERAELLDASGQHKRAISEYYRLLEIRPEDTNIRAALVESQLRRGFIEEALHQARLLAEMSETTDRARDWSLLGDALSAKGEKHAAEEAYEEALALRPDFPDALFGFGVHTALSGKTEDAQEYFTRLGAADISMASNVYTRSIRNGEELNQRMQATEKSPLNDAQTATLIEWHLKHGRLERAIDIYRSAPAWTPARTQRAASAIARIEASES